MGKLIIKQPNGKYCIFSTYIDNITYYDMTPEEVINIYVEEYKEEITLKIYNRIKQLNDDNYSFYKYNEMIDTIERIHGKENVDEIKNLIEK